MLTKTHLTIAAFLMLLLLPFVNYKIIFCSVLIISTLLVDIDSPNSFLGNYKILRPLQWLLKHRGFFHSFTLLIPLTIFFTFFIPIIAFPFFLGYGSHIFVDSFTKEGVQPFYPLKKTYSGRITTGGKTEIIVFVVFLVADLFLFIMRISSMF